MFNQDDVYKVEFANSFPDTRRAFQHLGLNDRVPVLVDSNGVVGSPDESVQGSDNDKNLRFFLAQASSPRKSRFKVWQKYQTGAQLVIANWSWEETYAVGFVF